jgi:microcystin-dependent protein
MLAQDILDLRDNLQKQVNALSGSAGNMEFFPIGTILMIDGSWQDGRGGWYICDGNEKTLPNGTKQRTPDLKDKFIKGSGSLSKEGGSNALTAAMVPKHTHSIYTDTTKNIARTADKTLTGEFRYMDDESRYLSAREASGVFSSALRRTIDRILYNGVSKNSSHNDTVYLDATHNHTGSASNDNSSTTDSNTSNMPLYYSVIYIKKMA